MKLARNSVLTLSSAIVPAIVMLVTVPLFLSTIGAERYGVLAVFWLVLIYAGQADFGIGRAITRRIAQVGSADQAQVAPVFWSGFALIALLGLFLAGATVIFLHWFMAGPFDLEASLRQEALAAAIWLGPCVYVLALFGVTQAYLAGRESFGAFASSAIVANSAIQILPLLCAIFIAKDLTSLVIATLIGRLLGLALSGTQVWRRGIGGASIAPSRIEMREQLAFGKWIMISVMTRPLMATLDRLVIASQLGALAVAIYTIPFQIASRFQMLPQAVWQAVFPRVSSLSDGEARKLAGEALSFIAIGCVPFAVGVICLADPLMTLWLGDNLQRQSVFLAQVMIAAFWLSGIGMVSLGFMYSRGASRFGGLLHVIELPLYALALFLAAASFGLVGIVTAFALRIALDAAILTWRCGLWREMKFSHLFAALGLVAVSLWLGQNFTDWMTATLCALALGGVASVFAFITMPDAMKRAIAQARRPAQKEHQ